MNQVKNRLLQLLDEIDCICKENNINYTLSANASAAARLYGNLPDNVNEISVYMTLSDFFAFKNIVERSCYKNRIIEGMDNNCHFPGLYYRYTDLNSTYYNYNTGNTFKYNGIHVNIEILRNSCSGQKELVYEEKNFAASNFKYKSGANLKNWLYRKIAKLNMTFRKEKKCLKLYNRLLHHFMNNPNKFCTSYSLVKSNFKIVKYPSYLYTATEEIKLCEHSYRVAIDTEQQFETVFGKPLSRYELPAITMNPNFLISADVPFEEFLSDGKNRMKTCRKRQHYWITDRLHGAVIHYINKDWEILKCVSSRLDLIKIYMPMKEQITALYLKEDFEELTEILKLYDETVKENFKNSRMTIYFNKEIHAVYIAWLTMNGEKVLAGKLNKKIPDEWRKDNL